MENKSNTKKGFKKRDFLKEYNELFNSSKISEIKEMQWEKEGDLFQKFSMYDDSYVPIKTHGGTTLIKDFSL